MEKERRKKIGIVTCEGSDLPKEFIEKYQIEAVKYPVWFPDEEEEEIHDTKMLYQRMRAEKKLPQTSQPPPLRFRKAYIRALKNFEQILVIVMSKELTKCIISASQAKEIMPIEEKKRIFIFDSRLATIAEGLMVWKAQELINANKELSEILEELREFREHQLKFFGFVEDLNWLKHGGRLRKPMATAALALQKAGIRPALSIKDGEVVMAGLRPFARDRIPVILKELKKASKKGTIKVAIGQADVSEKDLSRLIDGIKKINGEILFVSELTPVIGAHAGPGTIIVSYY